ncbi:MAG: HD domain-containing phosphohydrolase [Pseudomonadota bacterium]
MTGCRLIPSGPELSKPKSQCKVLVVDDSRSMRALLAAYMEAEGYSVCTAENGVAALQAVVAHSPDLILLDIVMPEMDGYQTVRYLKRNESTRHIPVIFVTAEDDPASRLKGLQAGAEDFINKPIDPNELVARSRNLLRMKVYGDLLRDANRVLEQQVADKTREIQSHCLETVATLMRIAEFRDEGTGQHVNRISYYSSELADHLGMDNDFKRQIFYASPMHDIGKLAIPDHILLKNGGLDQSEWAIMKTHTTLGVKMLEGNRSPFLEMGKDIALCHHECWDGSGYPNGLKGEEIPVSARIMAICDVYDALRSNRPYKKALSHASAMYVISKGDERIQPEKFDPEILDTFVQHHDIFADIYAQSRKHNGASEPLPL